jgi:hypothetical protein
MPARATITVVSAVVDMGLPTEATVTSNYIEVEIVAYIDTSSDNQWVYETIPLGDVRFNSVEKNLTDITTLTDEIPLTFEKNTTETLALVESFVRVVTYKRDFTETFTLDDLSQIDKDFYGNKGNITYITDIIGLSHEKIASETLTLGDVVIVAITFYRNFTEIATVDDESSNSFEKVLTDSLVLDDAAWINKDYTGYKGNSFGLADTLASSTSKELTDTLVFSESFGLQSSKSIDGAVDTISISDLVAIANISGSTLNGAAFNTTTLN